MKTLEEIKNTCENWEDVDPRYYLFNITLDGELVGTFTTCNMEEGMMRTRLEEMIGDDGNGDARYRACYDKYGAVYWGGHSLVIEAV